jgi:hypothetical protein
VIVENFCRAVENMTKINRNLVYFKSTLVCQALQNTIRSELESPIVIARVVAVVNALVVNSDLQTQLGCDRFL